MFLRRATKWKQDLCFNWSIQISFPGYLRKRYENSQRCLIKKNMMELGRFDPKSFWYFKLAKIVKNLSLGGVKVAGDFRFSWWSSVVLIQVDSIQLKSFRSINKVDLIDVDLRMDRIDLLMDRNYFSLYRIDLYQNDRTPSRKPEISSHLHPAQG